MVFNPTREPNSFNPGILLLSLTHHTFMCFCRYLQFPLSFLYLFSLLPSYILLSMPNTIIIEYGGHHLVHIFCIQADQANPITLIIPICIIQFQYVNNRHFSHTQHNSQSPTIPKLNKGTGDHIPSQSFSPYHIYLGFVIMSELAAMYPLSEKIPSKQYLGTKKKSSSLWANGQKHQYCKPKNSHC